MSNADTNAAALASAITAIAPLWAKILHDAGFAPVEAHAFPGGGRVQAVFAKDGASDAKRLGKLLRKTGFARISVSEPDAVDPVWIVSASAPAA